MNTIFVSSTFQDMQQERDVLQNSVLPRIKELAKQYGKSIDLCDLRWGVNTLGMSEAESATKVLQVCFDEIDKARPFFIAILGDVYGWVPNIEVVEKNTIDRNITIDDLLGKSVTEMEISYGALKSTSSSDIRFYFREIKNKKKGLFLNSDIPKYYTRGTADDKKRMRTLKEKIEAKFSKQVRKYSVSWNKETSRFDGMDAFAELLYQDIKEMIIQRWGTIPELSEYERQQYQYQYAIDSDYLCINESQYILSSRMNQNNLQLNESTMHKQNYVLISPDEHGLDALFSSLCRKYKSNGAEIIPYECTQSVLASSTENMLRYFVTILEKREDKNTDITAEECAPRKKFNAILEKLDENLDYPMILAVRNIHYLDSDNILEWLPLKKYHNIHFLISCDKVFSTPSQYKEISAEFYFQENHIFSRNHLIEAYMARYHKELDQQVYYALLEKSNEKDNQYLELLMQRLLVLSQDDFEEIKNSGDGMDKISQYLQKIIDESPDSTVDFVLEQKSLLEVETSARFVRSVLAILSVLPYGISRSDLYRVLQADKISFSTLDMTLLCRRLPNVVNITLDGHYRMLQTQASSIISGDLVTEKEEWTKLLEHYMSEHFGLMESDNKRQISEFYRSQYLEIAVKAGKSDVLGSYLMNIGYDATYFSIAFYNLVEKRVFPLEALRLNFSKLSFDDTEWIANVLYRSISEQKLLLKQNFTQIVVGLWKEMLTNLRRHWNESERYNHCLFTVLYELGEMMHLCKIENPEKYLIEAKKVSKENFRKYPCRIWKVLHGVDLTEEEKKRGYDGNEIPEDSDVMFGFHGEIEDMELEQSWSDRVRVINNYLSIIYRNGGNIKAAEELEKESKLISHISDPDPQHKGQKELVGGITVIWPDEIEYKGVSIRKRRYKPDLRRNSALQIGREAHKLYSASQYTEAVKKYIESNDILLEIYEDGCTGEYYDLPDGSENSDDLRSMIKNECARDLSLNYHDMLGCIVENENDPRLSVFIDKMLEWAHIYDDYRNNMQSKGSLEDDYLVSATIYFYRKDRASFRDRIISDIDRYYTYRLEAHMKGEKTDKSIMQNRFQANTILYETVIADPSIGASVTDLLLKQSNAAVKANDFDGFVSITELTENLLKWMWNNSYNWNGTKCSLEYIYFHNISNQCMLWEQHHMEERLKQDAEKIKEMLINVKESENIIIAMQSMLRYAMLLFSSGDYRNTTPYADAIFEKIQSSGDLPEIELVNIYEKIVAMFSEAELLDKAHKIAVFCETLLQKMEQKGYYEELRSFDITPMQYSSFIVLKLITVYLNHAIALSRMESHVDADRYLCMAEKLVNEHPEVAVSEAGIVQRITIFRKNGLPKPKREEDFEQEYRKYKNEIETTLSRYMRSKEYDTSSLLRIVELIDKMTCMPEHEFFKNEYAMAKYYYVLSMLFGNVGRKDLAYQMLQKAAQIAENDDNKESLHADIYSDMCAYESSSQKKSFYSRKALTIYESLQANGKDYSSNSYAMTLYNASIISMEQSEYKTAMEYVKKACYIWKKLVQSTTDQQINAYLAEAQRLIIFLERKMK